MIKKNIAFFGIVISMLQPLFGASEFNQTPYWLCFTPGGSCTSLLVDHIKKAKESIDVQVYSFTSYPIASALKRAYDRGVKVRVIADKSNFKSKYFSFVPYMIKNHLPVYKDYRLNIAHNKVMIIDHKEVETGSFNFTKAAQVKNAENMLIIDNKELAQAYEQNFQKRLSVSTLQKKEKK